MNHSLKLILFLLLPILGWGQLGTSNPYSYYGIGEQIESDDAVQSSMGNAYLGYSDSMIVNYRDPSSYHKIAEGYPLFSIGLKSRYSIFSENSNTYEGNRVGIDHFVMAIPFAKRYGLAFGLNPMSKRGYNFTTQQLLEGDTMNYNYSGKGNVSRVFAGLSLGIIQTERASWSVGANAGHLFGFVSNTRTSNLSGSSFGGVGIESIRVKSFHLDLSTSFDFKLTATSRLKVAVAHELSQKWNSEFGTELYSSANVSDPSIYKMQDSTFIGGYIQSPSSSSVGLNYSFVMDRVTRKNKSYRSKLDLILSYRTVNYSAMRRISEGNTGVMYKGDYEHYSFGFQFQPDSKLMASGAGSSFWSRLNYRAGTYMGTLPTTLDNQTSTQFGTTFGIGIPLVIQRSISSLNIGVDVGQRAGTGSLSQTYYGVNLGVILSPSSADKWFRKLKLD
jgi:hypothetical protein